MRLDSQTKKICCVGAGYVGGPTSAVLASMVSDVDVTVVDINETRIAAWKSDTLPFSEPGLYEVVKLARDGSLSSTKMLGTAMQALNGHHVRRPNLFFSTVVDEKLQEADMIFVAVDTPPGPLESHGGAAPNLKTFYAIIRQIGRTMKRNFILVNKSTVPCGSADETKKILTSILPPDVHCEVLSNPEFLAEGTAINDLLYPDRVVVGSHLSRSGRAAALKLVDLYANWIPRDRIVTMNSQSAELAKLAANSFLAQRISTINAISAICDELGADVTDVSRACGLDHRIGPQMLRASLGFGGSCFRKDVLHLTHTAADLGLTKVANYLDGILAINQDQTDRFANRIMEVIPNKAARKTIAVLGFAFKQNTDDTRESPAIRVVSLLVQQGYYVQIFDPLVPASKISQDLQTSMYDLPDSAALIERQVRICTSVQEACEGAHGATITNGWDALKSSHPVFGRKDNDKVDVGRRRDAHNKEDVETTIRWDQIATTMHAPRLILDGHNILDERIASFGFQLEGVGRKHMVSCKQYGGSTVFGNLSERL